MCKKIYIDSGGRQEGETSWKHIWGHRLGGGQDIRPVRFTIFLILFHYYRLISYALKHFGFTQDLLKMVYITNRGMFLRKNGIQTK